MSICTFIFMSHLMSTLSLDWPIFLSSMARPSSCSMMSLAGAMQCSASAAPRAPSVPCNILLSSTFQSTYNIAPIALKIQAEHFRDEITRKLVDAHGISKASIATTGETAFSTGAAKGFKQQQRKHYKLKHEYCSMFGIGTV